MKASTVIFVIVLVTVSVINVKNAEASKKLLRPLVTLGDLGTVEGIFGHTAWTQRKYSKFIDIPYGATSQEGRFQRAKPVEAFDETYNGYVNDVPCPSPKNLDDILSYAEMFDYEDCLHLTIATPNRLGSMPVMVYLAGYDLQDSENEDDPDYLLEKDVVLVTVQYRGGPLGFLSTLTEQIPGNIGVLDVIDALRYIKKYIHYFGGDNTRVTLFGQYGNAALIHVLTMSPLCESEDLFHQVIYQSGSALMSGFTTKNPLEYAKEFGKRLECKNCEDVDSLNECLKSAELVALLHTFIDMEKEHIKMPYFTIGGPSRVLEDDPKVLLEKGAFRAYPAMGGVVQHAAMGSETLDNYDNKYKDFVTSLEKSLSENLTNVDHHNIIGKSFPSKIFNKLVLQSIWPGLIDLHSLDVKESTSKALAYNAGMKKSYLYAFNYLGASNRLQKGEDDGMDDISLTDDNIYLFPFRQYSETLDKDDKHMAKIMVDLWTSFAIYGEPYSLHIMTKWPAMIKEKVGPYMKLDAVPEIGYYYPDEFFTSVLETRKQFMLE